VSGPQRNRKGTVHLAKYQKVCTELDLLRRAVGNPALSGVHWLAIIGCALGPIAGWHCNERDIHGVVQR
jgi:hypothetical protein